MTSSASDSPTSKDTHEASRTTQQWWHAYPAPRSTPEYLDIDQVAEYVRLGDGTVAIIDVRRDDHGGGHVKGSHQHPAQTFYDSLQSFFETFGKVDKVVFYCGSSSGRGPRCAGWYQDYLDEHKETASKAFVLKGGIKAWLARFGQDVDLVDVD